VKIQKYIVGVERLGGEQAYMNQTSNGLTSDPAHARHFDIDHEKADILAWMDYERGKIAKWANMDTACIMLYETKITKVLADDVNWRTELQRNGVAKLSRLEIEALGLEKYEIERLAGEMIRIGLNSVSS